jgi:hypothetical protein
MKRVVLLGYLVLFFAQTVWAQETIEAPVWNVGDRWTYKSVTGNTWTNQVLEIKEDLYILKPGGAHSLNGYDKKSMNVKSIIEESARVLESDSSLRKLFDFPMSVGKKWSDVTTAYPATGETRQGKIVFDHDFQVKDIQEVTTPAGRFKAYRIHYSQKGRNSRKSGWVDFWYSPEIKNWIKREAEKGPYWEKTTWARDAELVSYTSK